MRVSELLMRGKENAVPGRDLVKLLSLHDLRELTQQIERERKDGFPICASTGAEKGYYLAAGPAELEEYIKSLGRRLHNVRQTREHLEHTLLQMTGQDRMGGW